MSASIGDVTGDRYDELADKLVTEIKGATVRLMRERVARAFALVARDKDAEILRLRSEVDRLTGWKIGAEAGADSMRAEVAHWKKLASRAEADTNRISAISTACANVAEKERARLNEEIARWVKVEHDADEAYTLAKARADRFETRVAQLEAALRDLHNEADSVSLNGDNSLDVCASFARALENARDALTPKMVDAYPAWNSGNALTLPVDHVADASKMIASPVDCAHANWHDTHHAGRLCDDCGEEIDS